MTYTQVQDLVDEKIEAEAREQIALDELWKELPAKGLTDTMPKRGLISPLPTYLTDWMRS